MIAAIACCLAVAVPAPGADDLDATIAAQRALLGRRDLDGLARLEAVEALLQAQERRLEQTAPGDHESRAGRLADLAADQFFLVLPMEGADLTCDFGLPAPSQRERARGAAERIDALAAEAEQQIEQALLAIESAPGYGRDVEAQLRRRRLAEEERDRRIAFLRGVGAYLRARLIETDGPARREGYSLASAALEPILEALPPASAATARRYAGLARLRFGNVEGGRTHLERVIAGAATTGDVIAARLGLVDAAEAAGGAAAALAELDRIEAGFGSEAPPALRLLVAERRLRVRLDQAAGAEPGPGQEQMLAAAWSAYLALLEDPAFAADRDTWRSVLVIKIAGAVGPDAPWPALPPMVAIARAQRLAHDAATAAEAVELLDRTAARRDLTDRDRAAILFETGRALLRAGSVDAAADRFNELARDYPDDPGAAQSIELAAMISLDLCRQRPGDAAARRRLAETLAVLLERYPDSPGANRWRLEAAGVARADGRFADAVATLDQVPPGAEEWLDAQVERVLVLAADAMTAAGGAARPAAERIPLCRAARSAAEQLRPRLADAVRSDPDRWADALLRLAVAEAEAALAMDDPEAAIAALDDGDGAAPPATRDASAARAALLRIDAWTALGRPDDVQREIGRLVAAAGPRAGPILLAMLEERSAAVRRLDDEGRADQAAARAATDLAPIADALAAWLGAPGDNPLHATVSVGVADAYRLARRFREAESIYAEVLRRNPDLLAALSGRAECLYELGEDLAAAMAIERRIASQATEGSPPWWLAQLRMLQILDRSGKNTQRIAPQIRQLRQRDASLGGERLRRQFDALERKH